MSKNATKSKSTPAVNGKRQYAPEFKQEALLLALRVGVRPTAEQLGLQPTQIYAWRGQERTAQQSAQLGQAQQAEVARLRRVVAEQAEELAILKKAAAYFARASK